MKVPFLKRFGAYVIDFFVIYMIVFLVTIFVPASDSYSKAIEERDKITTEAVNEEIEYTDYLNEYNEKSYYVVKEGAVFILIQSVIYLAYFGTFAYYNNGQTYGKKIMKIKIESNNSKPISHFSFILRATVIYGLFSDLITLLLVYLLPSSYASSVFIISYIQTMIVYISLFMILFRKDGRGFHDFISNSKVINCD